MLAREQVELFHQRLQAVRHGIIGSDDRMLPGIAGYGDFMGELIGDRSTV